MICCLAIALSILGLAAGIFLLMHSRKNFMGGLFDALSWLVIVAAIASIGCTAFCCAKKMRGACGDDGCRIEKRIEIREGAAGECHKEISEMHGCPHEMGAMKEGGSCCKEKATCGKGCCTMEGDSVVMDKAQCEMMMGKEACDKLCKERGRCVMHKDECSKLCAANGKECCMKK